MIMIQDDPMPTGADKPLRITGDPHKVQVSFRATHCMLLFLLFSIYTFYVLGRPLKTFLIFLFWLILSITCKVQIFCYAY